MTDLNENNLCCYKCEGQIGDNSSPRCQICQSSAHLECTAVKSTTWCHWNKVKREAWKCDNCKGKNNSSKINSHESFAADDSKEYTLKDVMKQVFSMHNDLLEFKQEFSDIKDDFQTLKIRIEQNEHNIDEVTDRQTNLEKENDYLRKKIESLQASQDESAQYSRIYNLLVYGLPVTSSENCLGLVKKIAAEIGFNIVDRDIDAVHRLSTKTTKNSKRNPGSAPVLIRFVNRSIKEEFRKKLKEVAITDKKFGGDGSTKLTSSDHLTQSNLQLLRQAQDLRNIGYDFIWSKNCQIFARKNSTSQVLKIRSSAMISDIISNAALGRK